MTRHIIDWWQHLTWAHATAVLMFVCLVVICAIVVRMEVRRDRHG